MLLLFSLCKEQKKDPVTIATPEPQKPCEGLKDTTIHRVFMFTPAPGDLEKLVKFIESKGELKQYQGDREPLYIKDAGIILTRLLCEEDIYNSPAESWHLDNVARISTNLKLVKPVPGAKGIFGTIQLTQCSFESKEERDRAVSIPKNQTV